MVYAFSLVAYLNAKNALTDFMARASRNLSYFLLQVAFPEKFKYFWLETFRKMALS